MSSPTASGLTAQFAAAVEMLSAVSHDVADFRAVDDSALVALSRLAAREKQLAEAHLALIAGEIAARSTRELGHSGLAQREGFRTTEELLRTTTGSTGREATTAVRVGRLVRDAAVEGSVDPETGDRFEAREPWLADVAAAVAAGVLSVGAADAIRTGLGSSTENVTVEMLAGAAHLLCAEASELDVDRLLRRAREVRDDLDNTGIADRERERFEKRSLRHFRLPDGMGRFVWDLDPENYAIVSELYDRATSPKRGVRFVSGDQKEIADRILADPRTINQLASDTMLGLLQAGAAADSSRMLGTGSAVIRVLVSAAGLAGGADCDKGGGTDGGAFHGRVEGMPDAISIQSVQRLSCDGATTHIGVDDRGNPLDVGDEKRLFTPKQRIALAVREEGCRFGPCERPPSMTEAHHIVPWSEGGRTDLDNGILLCKFHHLLIHNNGWRIERLGEQVFVVPPASLDPAQQPRPMPSKSAAMIEFLREAELREPARREAGQREAHPVGA